VAPGRVHRCGPIHTAGASMDRLGAQVCARGDDHAGIRRLGAQESRGGAHGRASRRCKVTLDWPTEGGPRVVVLPRCAPYFLRQPPGFALIEKCAGGVCSGGGYVLPASQDHFSMLASLQKECNGAVGIALLNYCALFCHV
jgi:hypothetical protein